MKLVCIKPQAAHWGSILTKGKEYEVIKEYNRDVQIITNYDEWYKNLSTISGSIEWIRKGYTQETLHEVIPGYITHEEMNRLYTKRISMPHFEVRTDDGNTMSLCILTDDEIFELGADVSKGRGTGRPAFGYTVYQLDDYFDYKSVRRDRKLNDILNG